MFIASCCQPVKEVEYVDRVEYRVPLMSKPADTNPPVWDVKINGDMLKYRERCEAQIAKCNVDKHGLYREVNGLED